MAIIFESLANQANGGTRTFGMFSKSVEYLCTQLKIDPNWLMMVMYIETAGTFNPKIENTSYRFTDCGGGYATGLIQFTPCTAVTLGTSVSNLKAMTGEEQLLYVKKYYTNLGVIGRMNSFFDVYLATFFPAGIGKPDDWVLQTSSISAGAVARANSGIDLNKDGQITIAEFKQWALGKVPVALYQQVFGTTDPRSLIQIPESTSPAIANVASQITTQQQPAPQQAGSSGLMWLLLLSAGAGLYFSKKKKKKR